MDNIIIEAVVDEWNRKLQGSGIAKVYYYRSEGYFLALFNSPSRIFHFSPTGPTAGCRLLNDRPGRPGEVNRFLLLLRKYVEGAYIRSFSKPPMDRIIDILLGKSRSGVLQNYRFVLEFTGRSGNASLLDTENRVLAVEHPVDSENRKLDLNLLYSPPLPISSLNIENIGMEDIERLYKKSVESGLSLESFLAAEVFGLGSLLAAETAAAMKKSLQHGWNFLLEVKRRRREKDFSPILYLPVSETSKKPAKPFFHIITPLEQAKGMRAVSYRTTSDVLTAAYIEFENRFKKASLRLRLEEAVKRERKTAERLIRNLQDDLSKFQDPEKYRVWGELLVASLTDAKKSGDTVEVKDVYDPAQKLVTIRIDPSLSIQANAERFFVFHKKSKRGKEIIQKKIEKTQERLNKIYQFQNKLTCAAEAELEILESELIEQGIIRAPVTPMSERKSSERTPFHRFISSEGMEMLVGRKAADNDTLTFKYAKDRDFWLHCAGSPGSHVIVKNPKKLERCPESTLVEAASLAAFYSKQRSGSKVQVNYTQRKYVKRLKNAPSGKVKLLSFESVIAKPEIPAGVTAEEGENVE